MPEVNPQAGEKGGARDAVEGGGIDVLERQDRCGWPAMFFLGRGFNHDDVRAAWRYNFRRPLDGVVLDL